MGEGHAPFHERVEIGSLEQWRAERMQTVRAMVVSVDVQDIKLPGFGGRQH